MILIKEHGDPCVSTALNSQIHTRWYLGTAVMEQSIGPVTVRGKQRHPLHSKAKLQQREANCINAEHFKASL